MVWNWISVKDKKEKLRLLDVKFPGMDLTLVSLKKPEIQIY